MTYPGDNEALRYKCHQIYHPSDRDRSVGSQVGSPRSFIGDVIDDLVGTLRETRNGIGLAANQLGYCMRIFVFRPNPAPDPYVDQIVVCIDPRITVPQHSEQAIMCEGCLSVPSPGCGVPVLRWGGVDLEYIDEHGVIRRDRLVRLNAQIAQHEVDHLDGILIIDTPHPQAVTI